MGSSLQAWLKALVSAASMTGFVVIHSRLISAAWSMKGAKDFGSVETFIAGDTAGLVGAVSAVALG